MWSLLVIKDDLLKHCNKRAIFTRIVVPAPYRQQDFRSLTSLDIVYKASLRNIAQRFWWPRVRASMCELLKSNEVCDIYEEAKPAPRAFL